jgi:hypothetical protein
MPCLFLFLIFLRAQEVAPIPGTSIDPDGIGGRRLHIACPVPFVINTAGNAAGFGRGNPGRQAKSREEDAYAHLLLPGSSHPSIQKERSERPRCARDVCRLYFFRHRTERIRGPIRLGRSIPDERTISIVTSSHQPQRKLR